MNFLELMTVRGLANEITDLAQPNNYEETETDGADGYLRRLEGVSKLTFQTSQGDQELILTRRLAKEVNPDTHEEEVVVNMVRD
jgi:hypothetical protein